MYVIARVNFLTSDIICDFFGTKKTTTGNKATSIETTFNIGIGDEHYCTREIIESFSFVEMPGGFIVPETMQSMIVSLGGLMPKQVIPRASHNVVRQFTRLHKSFDWISIKLHFSQKNCCKAVKHCVYCVGVSQVCLPTLEKHSQQSVRNAG